MGYQGYIKLYRQLEECELWLIDEPFDKRSAWIDLLLMCNHREKQIIFKGEPMVISRGQYLTSVRKLSVKWGWGKDKTLKFLRLLETLGMITREADSTKTLITIDKYEVFQGIDNVTADSNKDSLQTASRHTPATNNNEKNDKNEKNNKYMCAFEELWKVYPRKVDKGRAYKCYLARLHSGYSEAELMTATINYAEECKKNNTEQKYIKHASTFFSDSTPFADYLRKEINAPRKYNTIGID